VKYIYLLLAASLVGGLLAILWKVTRVVPYQELNQEQSKSISISNSLGDLFVRFHTIGSIAIRGKCSDANFVIDEVPQGPTGNFSSFKDALAAWSNLVPRLKTYSDANGVWRVNDITASADLLRVRIGDLRVRVLDSEEAVAAVLATKEVQGFFRDNGIKEASITIGLVPYDGDKFPRSVWDVRGLTVAEAFDEAVIKYPGVWVYRECIEEKQKLVNVRTRSF
jgi:hypothetical protein